MIQLDHTIDLLTGGTYTGNSSWNKTHSDVDNCFKIYQITDGELSLFDGNENFLLQSGRLCFINGHKLVSQQCSKYFSTNWLHFTPKDLVIHHSLLSAPLLVDLTETMSFVTGSMKQVEALVSGGYASFKDCCIESLRIQASIQLMIVSLLENYSWTSPQDIYLIHSIEPAIFYIKKHFTESIQLKQLADCCNLSPNHFHKKFTQALRHTPARYITLLRMNAALPLLSSHDYTIKEIAYQLGFSDDAYFSRVFKQYYNITPGEYRKKRNELLF